MLKLYKAEKDGVVALITAKDARDYRLVIMGNGCPFRAGVKVFTFADEKILAQNPWMRHVYSGSKEFMAVALETIVGKGNYEIAENDSLASGWNGETPLFESEKLTYNKDGLTPVWQRFCTTAEDMFVKFGEVDK